MNVIYDKDTQKVPIKIWSELSTVEDSAIEQLKNTASLPFVFKHVAAMPDVHLGIGATVGSVVATQGAVIPAAVGVDIGCGMMAIKLGVEPQRVLDKAKEIRHSIERSIPVGFAKNKNVTDQVAHWKGWLTFQDLTATKLTRKSENELRGSALHQMGTLGGGNHFIELCQDKTGAIWVMLHSGSRGIGNQLARVHMNEAKEEMKRMFIALPDPDLAYFAEGTKFYEDYMRDLNWCQEYAAENRREMMRRVLKDISHAIGFSGDLVPLNFKEEDAINCHHNYATKENHYGENVLITRKGAVRARTGDLGIIPGSMGARSFIVRGLGSQESFCSCSHGAGRKMSRTKARASFTLTDLATQTNGVECRKDEGVLDEIPSAYKDIDTVMHNQKDLVEVVAELKQFLCVKG